MKAQRGSVLIIVMIFMFVLTALGLKMLDAGLVDAHMNQQDFRRLQGYANLDLLVAQLNREPIESLLNRCGSKSCDSPSGIRYHISQLADEPCQQLKSAEKPGVRYYQLDLTVGPLMAEAIISTPFLSGVICPSLEWVLPKNNSVIVLN